MATYSVLESRTENYGTSKDRVKTRREADARLEQVRATGRFARLVRWHNGEPKEMARVNDQIGGNTNGDD